MLQNVLQSSILKSLIFPDSACQVRPQHLYKLH